MSQKTKDWTWKYLLEKDKHLQTTNLLGSMWVFRVYNLYTGNYLVPEEARVNEAKNLYFWIKPTMAMNISILNHVL